MNFQRRSISQAVPRRRISSPFLADRGDPAYSFLPIVVNFDFISCRFLHSYPMFFASLFTHDAAGIPLPRRKEEKEEEEEGEADLGGGMDMFGGDEGGDY